MDRLSSSGGPLTISDLELRVSKPENTWYNWGEGGGSPSLPHLKCDAGSAALEETRSKRDRLQRTRNICFCSCSFRCTAANCMLVHCLQGPACISVYTRGQHDVIPYQEVSLKVIIAVLVKCVMLNGQACTCHLLTGI